MSRPRSGWTSKVSSPHLTVILRMPRAGPSSSVKPVLQATWSMRPTSDSSSWALCG
jgi:hypothetical protein